ncbi:MAG TPA: P-loop-containing protein [Albitalea sp.]|nr:P-loop-containing protein [Albitalea sp.]
MVALFIVGEPGVGKTTLVRGLLGANARGELPIDSSLVPKPKWTLVNTRLGNIAAAGHYTGAPFDGGDSVPYNGVAEALNYVAERKGELSLVVFDGDRFSNSGVQATLRLLDFELACVRIDLPSEQAEQRRKARAEAAVAKLQNESWVKGRRTKSQRFSETFEDLIVLDGSRASAELLDDLYEFLEGLGR